MLSSFLSMVSQREGSSSHIKMKQRMSDVRECAQTLSQITVGLLKGG